VESGLGRQVVLWRHGRTAWNAERRFQGQLDVPLDSVGVAQARRAASLLAAMSPSAIVCSDLGRAADTAGALADLVGLVPVVDPRLRETFGGSWQGLDRAEIEALAPGSSRPGSWGVDVRPGGRENQAEVAERGVAAVLDCAGRRARRWGAGGGHHGGTARAVLGRMTGLPEEHWSALGGLTNCSWSVLGEASPAAVSHGGSPWRLLEHNAGTLPEPVLGDDS
jgi:probable phosphoglycerate mutase